MPKSHTSRSPLALVLALAILTSAAATGCSLQKFTADSTADLLLAGSVSMDRESDLEFARDALPGNLKTVETFLVSTPENEKLLLLLAKGYTSYAFAFLEGDLDKAQLHGTQKEVDSLNRRAVLHYLRGRAYGFRLLARPALERAAKAGDLNTLDRELRALEESDTPGLFWTTYAWASAINLSQNDPDMVAALPVIEKMMGRVLQLDPGYFYSGADLFLGVYYASRPVMFGGDPDKAKRHFEAAIAREGDDNLLAHYMYGRFYAAQVQDRELFNAMMKKVIEARVDETPDARLNNEIARDRARFWVDNVGEIFLE